MKVFSIHNHTGGTDVILECDPPEVERLTMEGRNMAMKAAREKNFMANAIASELGPMPFDKSNDKPLSLPEDLKAAQDSNSMVYRTKYTLHFVG